jgi:hypothetical protein
MNTSRVAVIIDRPGGTWGVVIFASRAAAEKWRDVAEEKGVETRGIVDVVSRVDALLDR